MPMFGTPGFLGNAPAVVTPKPPPGVSFAGTIVGAAQSFVQGGGGGAGIQAAANVALAAVGTAVPAVGVALGALSLAGIDLASMLTTKSKANWRRTWGRIYRAALLGYVPPLAGAESILSQIGAAWIRSGDQSGAGLWDAVVKVFGVPTEKGGTKEGFNSGAPAGSKRAEAMPGFSSGLLSFLAAIGA